MDERQLRNAIIAAVRRLDALGLNRGSTGNMSARSGDGFLVTPTGMPPGALLPQDLPLMHPDGTWRGERNPSSEWRFHRDIYAARPEADAVVHTHSPFATTLACLHRGVPAFHYMVAIAGGKDIRCAPYATFGTQELSDYALQALEGRKACLLANHGLIALGESLAQAFTVAIEVESLCEQYWRALQVGEPHLLPDAEMDRVIEKFRSYGQQK
jgi:L-fuculose-phosphate aldolase